MCSRSGLSGVRSRQRRNKMLTSKRTTIHRQAIPLVVKARQSQTCQRLTREEVIRVSEVLQTRQRTNTRQNLPRQQVVGHIELLKAHHPSNRLR
ncbi:hypothetical protein EV1_045519 [Malus domestica]